jgi:exodeoxyribonuclease VII small subunit
MTTKKIEKKTGTGEPESGQSFEKALERLEKIVSEMESGSMSLEDMITRFEEGQSLIKFCSRKLNEVERKIEILVKKGDGTTTEPFEEEPEEEKSENP